MLEIFTLLLSIPAEQRSQVKPTFPVMIVDHVVVATHRCQFPSLQKIEDAAASINGAPGRAEGVVLHAVALKKKVVADEDHIFKYVEREARGVSVHVVGLNALMDEVFLEGDVESEGTTDVVIGIVVMDTHLSREKLSVEIGGAEEVVVGKKNGVCFLYGCVEGGWAVNPTRSVAGFDAVGSMLDA